MYIMYLGVLENEHAVKIVLVRDKASIWSHKIVIKAKAWVDALYRALYQANLFLEMSNRKGKSPSFKTSTKPLPRQIKDGTGFPIRRQSLLLTTPPFFLTG